MLKRAWAARSLGRVAHFAKEGTHGSQASPQGKSSPGVRLRPSQAEGLSGWHHPCVWAGRGHERRRGAGKHLFARRRKARLRPRGHHQGHGVVPGHLRMDRPPGCGLSAGCAHQARLLRGSARRQRPQEGRADGRRGGRAHHGVPLAAERRRRHHRPARGLRGRARPQRRSRNRLQRPRHGVSCRGARGGSRRSRGCGRGSCPRPAAL